MACSEASSCRLSRCAARPPPSPPCLHGLLGRRRVPIDVQRSSCRSWSRQRLSPSGALLHFLARVVLPVPRPGVWHGVAGCGPSVMWSGSFVPPAASSGLDGGCAEADVWERAAVGLLLCGWCQCYLVTTSMVAQSCGHSICIDVSAPGCQALSCTCLHQGSPI
eukprot:254743-Chlamydomonas_euryale.AAC.1